MRNLKMLAAGAAFGVAGFMAAPAPCTPVAFVDINKVLKDYPRAKQLIMDLTAEADKVKADFTSREADLNRAFGDLDAKFDPGTPEYEKERRRIQLLKGEIQYDRQAAGESIGRKQVRGMAAVYKEICAAAQLIAERKGFSCVQNLDTDPIQVEDRGQVLGPNELKLQMALRPVLWAKEELDITREVVAELDKSK